MSALLSTHGLSVSYGGVHALKPLDIEIGERELVGLIGPNGAGKTTCIDALTGFTPAGGQVMLDGADLSGMRPERRVRLGLSRTWQAAELFEDLSVADNLAVAASSSGLTASFKDIFLGKRERAAVIGETLELLGLRELADVRPGELTQGQRKLVGVGRALASKPRVLCLDEPAAGLNSHESHVLGERLRAITDSGVSLLLIDHDMGLVLEVCDRVVVINFGEMVASAEPEVIRKDPRVIEAYLGEQAKADDDGVVVPALKEHHDE